MTDYNEPQLCRCNSLAYDFTPCLSRKTDRIDTYVICSTLFDSGERCPQRANKACYLVQQNGEVGALFPAPFICSECVNDIAQDLIYEANETGGNVFQINDQRKDAPRIPLAEINVDANNG
jgi:hypothetical protein